mmetsp:Transcript_12795/g.24321  ORF Transcript_12795/g.24321 Transcript_12795/m.24321 type:complete len:218 (+) Transcript_12795:266-919(+)
MRSFYTALLLLVPTAVVAFMTTPSCHFSQSTVFRNQQAMTTSPIWALQFLAEDAEKEGTHNEEKAAWEKSWIPTSNGGFLPNLGKIGKKNEVYEITSLEEYREHVAQEKEKLVVVRFYAPWCRACKAIALFYQQLPRLYPDVKFVQVPLNAETGVLHQGLRVPSLPFGHIYHPEGGLVEERRISKKFFKEFKDQVLKSYVNGYCPVQYNEDGTNTHA